MIRLTTAYWNPNDPIGPQSVIDVRSHDELSSGLTWTIDTNDSVNRFDVLPSPPAPSLYVPIEGWLLPQPSGAPLS